MKREKYLKQLRQTWNNLNFRNKLTILLVGVSILSIIITTQGIQSIVEKALIENLKSKLVIATNSIENEFDSATKYEQRTALDLANIVESQGWLLNRPEQLAGLRNVVSNYIHLNADESFYIITDAQGKTIAQYIQEVPVDYSINILEPGQKPPKVPFTPVTLPSGIELGDIPIVRDSLSNRRPLSGVELFKIEWLERLGLKRQASMEVKSQKTKGLSEPQQPFPLGTFPEEGQLGLVMVTVQPIKIEEKLVGTVIVGRLLNRNYEMADKITQQNTLNGISIDAQDLRVSTSSHNGETKARPIGTRVAREVAEKVLNQKQSFIGFTSVIGHINLASYRPLYDHEQTLNPTSAMPIGIVSTGIGDIEVQTALNNLRIAGWAIGVGTAILAGLAAFPIAGAFSNPLRRLTNSVQRIGEGDLTTLVEVTDAQDEIGKLLASFRNMTQNLNNLIRQVQKSGVQMTTSTTQIAASGKQLEATMTEQLALTEEVAGTANEIAATSKQLVKTMDDVDHSSQVTAQSANESRTYLIQMETVMSELVDATSITSIQLDAISEKANNINSIIATITKIADRTNLLSLNATIEAEKAGDYGKGFIVIAKEVARLASQSGVATLEIEKMVEEMQTAVTTGVKEIDKFTQKVKQSASDVRNIGTFLASIIQQVQALSPRFQQVSNSIEAQSEDAVQISEAMGQLSEAASQTTMSLVEVNQVINDLTKVAQDLRQEISKFKI